MERVVRTDLGVLLEAVEVHLVVPVQAAAAVVGIGESGLDGFGGLGIWGLGFGGLVYEAVAVGDFGFLGAGLEPVVEGEVRFDEFGFGGIV